MRRSPEEYYKLIDFFTILMKISKNLKISPVDFGKIKLLLMEVVYLEECKNLEKGGKSRKLL